MDGRSRLSSAEAPRLDRKLYVPVSRALFDEIDASVAAIARHSDPEITRASLVRRLIRIGLRKIAASRHAS